MTTIMSKDAPAIEQMAGLSIKEKLASVTEDGDQAILVVLHEHKVEHASTDTSSERTARKIAEEWRAEDLSRQENARAQAAKAIEDARTARVAAERLAHEASVAAKTADRVAKKAERLREGVSA